MKRTYQVQRAITVAANSTQVFNFQLKENYAKCTGVFLTPFTNGAVYGTDFNYLTIGLDIAQTEILPKGMDASIIALTPYISRADATYDFSADNIPARSSDVQLSVTNTDPINPQVFSIYFVLEN